MICHCNTFGRNGEKRRILVFHSLFAGSILPKTADINHLNVVFNTRREENVENHVETVNYSTYNQTFPKAVAVVQRIFHKSYRFSQRPLL